MLRLNAKLFAHISDHIGLTDRLAAGDWQRPIGIGNPGEVAVHKMLARNFIQSAQHRGVCNAAPAQHQEELHATDALVGCRWLGHSASSYGLIGSVAKPKPENTPLMYVMQGRINPWDTGPT